METTKNQSGRAVRNIAEAARNKGGVPRCLGSQQDTAGGGGGGGSQGSQQYKVMADESWVSWFHRSSLSEDLGVVLEH